MPTDQEIYEQAVQIFDKATETANATYRVKLQNAQAVYDDAVNAAYHECVQDHVLAGNIFRDAGRHYHIVKNQTP